MHKGKRQEDGRRCSSLEQQAEMVFACISRKKKKKVHRKQREELGVTKFHRSTAITSALVRVNTFPESRSRHRHVGNTIRKMKTQKRTRLTFGRPCTCTLFFRKNKKQETIMQHETKPHEFDSNSIRNAQLCRND